VNSAKLHLENGEIYNGSLLSGKRHGFGTQIENNGAFLFTGEWRDDRKHGKGTLAA
jgi:hypothetical protein